MRMLHFSAEDGTQEAVWFTDDDYTPQDIIEELDTWREVGWSLDWEEVVESTVAMPATETPYFKAR